MPTPLQPGELKDLKQSLEEELERLKGLALKIERAVRATRVSEAIENARGHQMDSNWLKELRKQYNEEVCQSTLRSNNLFPVAEE